MQFRLNKKSNKAEKVNKDFEKKQAEAFKYFMKTHFSESKSLCKVAYTLDEKGNE